MPIEAQTGDDGLRAGSASSFLVSPWNKNAISNVFYIYKSKVGCGVQVDFPEFTMGSATSTQNPPLGGTTPVLWVKRCRGLWDKETSSQLGNKFTIIYYSRNCWNQNLFHIKQPTAKLVQHNPPVQQHGQVNNPSLLGDFFLQVFHFQPLPVGLQ